MRHSPLNRKPTKTAKFDKSFSNFFERFPGTPNSLEKYQLMLLGRVALARHRHGADWCPQGFRTGWSKSSIRNSRDVDLVKHLRCMPPTGIPNAEFPGIWRQSPRSAPGHPYKNGDSLTTGEPVKRLTINKSMTSASLREKPQTRFSVLRKDFKISERSFLTHMAGRPNAGSAR